MARSTQLAILSVAFFLLFVKPAYAQPLGVIDLSPFSGGGFGSMASNIPGVALLSNIGTGDTLASVLSTMGINQGVIDTIVAPLANSREAANTVRDVIASNAASRPGVMGPMGTPAQAISAFNDLMNSAFRSAAGQLVDTVVSRGGGGGGGGRAGGSSTSFRSSTAAGSDADGNSSTNSSVRSSSPSVIVGFGLPVDPSVFADGFTAGANLPPVVSATGPDYTAFQQQLYADIVRQNEAVAEFQKQAAKKEKTDETLKKACGQYALSEFLESLAQMLLRFGQPASATFSVLAQFSGLTYSALTPQGKAYLNVFCCQKIREAGIDVGLLDDGTIVAGPLSGISLDALLGIPSTVAAGVGAPAEVTEGIDKVTGAIAGALASVDNSLTGLLGGSGSGSGGSSSDRQPKCNILDWLVFALQSDPQLMKQFTDLIQVTMQRCPSKFLYAAPGIL
ncbi:hypothetical protein VOLCADRAFT_87955 [Volvox carteri f. nagariensis]|uniref:Uncharacterized protein n=1 Tax=Volvox carteri f. nagariensis TaxID=3068 RepID=D8TMP2_VOLCA|nr:uncharacterized protein VOLCADRAFT_87955 [Volvox carteri f. nagariensis]EFJ51288.1 hypothetical protein VOLCADRAFT_87955 [Volvox carteri f. nagariensis]|eukprot:XP_002947755.1 hypothetical protein VOLCADRAFT_87955 [Volvox carteri f. nagariensis]